MLLQVSGVSSNVTSRAHATKRKVLNLFETWEYHPEEPVVDDISGSEPFWPGQGRDLNRSGLSPWASLRGNFSVRKKWRWGEPRTGHKEVKASGEYVPNYKAFVGTPVLDGQGNVYIASSLGWLYSLDSMGFARWLTELSGFNPGGIAMASGIIFTATDNGEAVGVKATTGRIVWKTKIGKNAPGNPYAAAASKDLVLLPATSWPYNKSSRKQATTGQGNIELDLRTGAEQLVALNPSDGKIKWRYRMTQKTGRIMYSVAPAIVGNKVVVSDIAGGVYCLAAADGSEIWYTPGIGQTGGWSTGGLAVGPNDRIYVASQLKQAKDTNGPGVLWALDLSNGNVLWNRTFTNALTASPAVGRLAGSSELAVVVGTGDNRLGEYLSPTLKNFWKDSWIRGNRLDMETGVAAVRARDGSTLWSYNISIADSPVQVVGVLSRTRCSADLWSPPTVTADGAVLINWSGGKLLSLRDANGDGRIDARDTRELAEFGTGHGATGAPAMGPGVLVAASCGEVLSFAEG